MRYRRSREIRQRLKTESWRFDQLVRRALVTLGFLTIAGWGGWALFFSSRETPVIGRLLYKPLPELRTIDTKTARYKSAEERYRTNDFAVAGALTNLQVAPERMKQTQAWRPESDGTWTPAKRTIRVSSFYALAQCNLEFTRSITAVGGTIASAVEHNRGRELTIQAGDETLLTHELTIIRDPDILRKVGHMAIIIDELGAGSGEVTQQFMEIPRPLTFALIPWQPVSKRLADEALKRKQEVVVHLPMEPQGYPRVSPGRRAILLGQSEQQNRRVVQDALSALPAASGILNYMGNRAMESNDVMRLVMEEIKNGGKYFINSGASKQPASLTQARNLGVEMAASWGYLDTVDNQERIAMMLDLASYTALEQGPVVVIGHARPNTLTVLQQKLDRLQLRGIQLVHVSSLIRNEHGQEAVH